MRDPTFALDQAAVHQLRHSAIDIETGDGVIYEFDYDEMIDQDLRKVTLELTYLLPE